MRAGAAVRPLRRIAAAVLVAVCAAADGSAQLHHGQLRAADKGCTISATAVSFGAYDALNPSPNDSQGSISYSCGTQNGPRDKPRTPITNIQIALSPGFSGSYERAMGGGSMPLSYNVYLDATRQTIWGDGSAGTDVLRHANPQNHETYTATIYGRIPAQQDIPPGSYFDSLVATILF